jgi:DNA-binding MarR family transcriptional regulator
VGQQEKVQVGSGEAFAGHIAGVSSGQYEDDIAQVLSAIRRLIRAADLHSRHVTRTAGLTSSQLILLKCVRDSTAITVGQLATNISVSQATVTNILDRLEQVAFVRRERSESDRRRVYVHLTPLGREVLETSPEPLQETFIRQFSALKDWERNMILASLQRVAEMMDAEHIDASPLLDVGQLDRRG